MKLKHYVIENSVLAEHPLHSYDTPLTSVAGKKFSISLGFYYVTTVFTEGPAVLFDTPENRVGILSKSKLSRWYNFIDTRLRRFVDPVRIVDAKAPVNVRDIEEAILGTCEVPGCNEIALYEEGDPTLTCSPDHMKKLCGYEGIKRVPLNDFTDVRPVKIHL